MKIFAPFSREQVEALNNWQRRIGVHPYTCPHHSHQALVATTTGWHCSAFGCNYSQVWAHDFSLKD